MKKATHLTKRAALLVLSLVMILSVTAGGTLAYLILSTQNVTNTFQPGDVSTTTEETFDEYEKKDVYISNEKSNVDVYVRAKVVITWVDNNGNTLADKPVEAVDYDIAYGVNWIQGNEDDDYWYCEELVEAGQKTPNLIESCIPKKDAGPADAHLQVTILSQSVQATEEALRDAGWAWAIPEIKPLAN